MFQRRLDRRHRLDGDHQAFLWELLHQLHEAHARPAQQMIRRHAHVLEEQLRRVLRLHPDLLEIAAALETLGLRLDGDQRRAFGAELGIGLGDHDHQVGELAVGDEGLGAVDDPLVAVHDGRRLDRLQVGARPRLGHGDGRDQFAGAGLRDPLLLLLLGAVVEQVGNHDVVVQREGRTRRQRAALLLDHDGAVEEIRAGAAIGLGHGHAQKPLLAGLAPQVARHDPLLLPFHVERSHFLLEKAPAGVAEHLVFGRVVRGQSSHERRPPTNRMVSLLEGTVGRLWFVRQHSVGSLPLRKRQRRLRREGHDHRQ